MSSIVSAVSSVGFTFPTDAAEAWGAIAVELNAVAGNEEDIAASSITLWKATTDPPTASTTNIQVGYLENFGSQRQNGAGQFNDTTTPWPLPVEAAPGGRPGRAVKVVIPSNYTRVEHLPYHKDFGVGDEYYFSQAFYLASDFYLAADYFQIIEQIHHDGNGSPPIAFEILQGNLRLTGGVSPYNYNINILSNVQVERWYNLVYKLNFSDAYNTSKITVWVDGTICVDNFTIPPQTVTAGAGLSYRKQGIYHDSTDPGMTIYSAGSAYGTSYAAVDPTLVLVIPKIGNFFPFFNQF
jgi:hypothetical protein